jgi:hypothetical protein
MKHEPSVFDIPNPQTEAAAEARALDDLAANRVISHDAVTVWLKSWGSGNRLPTPKVGD